MRAWVVWSGLCVVAAAGRASADPKAGGKAAKAAAGSQGEVEALARKNLAAISKRAIDLADYGVDASTVAYAANGGRWAATPDDTTQWYDVLFTGFDGSVEIAPKPGFVVADDAAGVAWFQLPYVAKLTPDPAPDDVSKIPERIGGIAVKDHGAWHLGAVAYTDLISDKELLAVEPHGGWWKEAPKPDFHGEDKLARDVLAGWFDSGFAAHAGPTDKLLASGSSEGEFQRGAAALKMVKGWDALKLRPWQIDAYLVAGGKLAFFSARVLLPVKKSGRYTFLQLFGVLVPDGKDWRWVSLQYGATQR